MYKVFYAAVVYCLLSVSVYAGCNDKSLKKNWNVYFTDLTSGTVWNCDFGKDTCTNLNTGDSTDTPDTTITNIDKKSCKFTVVISLSPGINGVNTLFIDGQLNSNKNGIINGFTGKGLPEQNVLVNGTFTGFSY